MRDEKPKKQFTKFTSILINLPPELLLHCLSFITSPKDLVFLSKVNCKLHEIALDRILWQKFKNLKPLTKVEVKHIPQKIKKISALISLSTGHLVSYDYKYFFLFDTNTFECLTKKRSNSQITAICALPSGIFISGHKNGTINLWRVEIDKKNGKHDFKINNIQFKFYHKLFCKCNERSKCTGIQALAWLTKEYFISASCEKGVIRIWSYKSSLPKLAGVKSPPQYGVYTHLAVLPDKTFITSGNNMQNGNLVLWKTGLSFGYSIYTTPIFDEVITDNIGKVIALRALPNGNFVTIATDNVNLINIWELPSGKSNKSLKEHTKIDKMGVLKNGLLYSAIFHGGYSRKRCVGKINFWNTSSGKCLNREVNEAKFTYRNGYKVCFVELNDGRLVCGSSHIGFFVYTLHFSSIPENRLIYKTDQVDKSSYTKHHC